MQERKIMNPYPKKGQIVSSAYKNQFPLDAEGAPQVSGDSRYLNQMAQTAFTEAAWKNPELMKEYLKLQGSEVPKALETSKESLQLNFYKEGAKAYQSFKEDLTTTNTVTFVPFLEQTVRGDFMANMEQILGLLYTNDDLMKNPGGANSLAISVGEPTEAAVYSQGGQITYYADAVNQVQVTPLKIAAGTSITWELTKYAQPAFMKWNLKRASNSLERYVAIYILNMLTAGTGHAVATGGLTYDKILAARKEILSATATNGVVYGFVPNKLVLSPAGGEKFYGDSTIKNYVYFSALLNSAKNGTELAKPVVYFFNMEVIETPYLTATVSNNAVHAIVLDSTKAGMFIKASDIEVFEGRLPKTAGDREVILAMLMNVVILFSKAIYVITA